MEIDNLYKKRHSLAHLLAIAIREFDPQVKIAIGPVIDNGFYYDFEFSPNKTPSPEDLKNVQKKMKKCISRKLQFECEEKTPEEARALFENEPYKLELIDEIIKTGEKITVYKTGDFVDLCRGPHVQNTEEIDPKSFELDRIAGAYWRGDEKNKQLTRIYGIAFNNTEELSAYKALREEALKRDHKKLGKELGLFVFSPLVGPGLPLWTPKGTLIRNLLDDFVWQLRKAKGYERVTIPHLTKKDLYETSGHWKKFANELFRIKTREGKEYALKPMNCPHHTQIFASTPRSYRDMPQRYAETTMVYRDEQSGELSGLSRVLSITQDDAHVFARHDQIEEEVFAIWDIIDTFYRTFDFKDLEIRFSRHNPDTFEKYIGTKETWQQAENTLTSLIKKRGMPYIDGLGEAALYGPKIDFIAKDSLGRTLQVATIQLDFNMPKNFELHYINEEGKKDDVVMIHCAIMGSLERFIATLIEHTGGAFPFWLSPVQVKILPISDSHKDFAKEIFQTLTTAGLRAEIDESDNGLGKKVRTAKIEKVPYFLIIGDKELETKTITVESRDEGNSTPQSVEDFLNSIRDIQKPL